MIQHRLLSNTIKNDLKFLTIVVVLFSSVFTNAQLKSDTKETWKKMESVLKTMKSPSFPNKSFNIINYGAKPNSSSDNTQSIKKAIQECAKNGGGIVVVPKGKYLTSAIHLESNVNLHLEQGAELLFSTNPKNFLPLVHTSFEGTECMNYSPLIYAYQKTNVAITGKGTINAQANNDNWWSWCGKDTYGWKEGMPKQQKDIENLMAMAEKGIAVSDRIFGENHYLRPNFVEFFECTNVLIKGIKVINAPFWVLHPIKSTNVIVDGVSINSHGPNNDGCDPEYSKNVNIKNCTFNTGDDCIAIKAGRDADGRRVGIKTENIIVQNCKMYDGHGGVTIGSEMSAGVSNVYVENCNFEQITTISSPVTEGSGTTSVKFDGCTRGTTPTAVTGLDRLTATKPAYAYTVLPVSDVATYVSNATCGAGATLSVTATGVISSACPNLGLGYQEMQLGSLYPTVVDTVLNIEFSKNVGGETTITIFSSLGTKVLTYSKTTNPAEKLSLDVSNLAKGLYLCNFQVAETTTTWKFIKK